MELVGAVEESDVLTAELFTGEEQRHV